MRRRVSPFWTAYWRLATWLGPFGVPLRWYANRGPKKRAKERTQRVQNYWESWHDRHPQILPPLRPRALSLHEHTPRREQTASAFFTKLSYDVRLMIYEEVLGGNTLHIARIKTRDERDKLGCKVCPENHHRALYSHECWWGPGWPYEDELWREEFHTQGQELLGIVKTCRQAYAESINIAYSSNIIDTAGRLTMLILWTTLLPQRMNAIRNLQILFNYSHPLYSTSRRHEDFLDEEALWEKTWGIISSMKRLRELRVAIRDNARVGRVINASKILRPLKAVKGLEVFDVEVLWSPAGNDAAALGEDFPFRLMPVGYLGEQWACKYHLTSE